jgi:hypothetical protein
MRYSEKEQTILVGQFKSGLNVNIKILDLANDAEIPVTNIKCRESVVMPGIYLWSTSRINIAGFDGFKNLLYEMTSSEGTKYYGKFLYGGYVDDEISVIMEENPESYKHIMKLLKIINGRI